MEQKRIKQLTILSGFAVASIIFALISNIIVLATASGPNPISEIFLAINLALSSISIIISNVGSLSVSSIILYKMNNKEEKYYPIMKTIAIMFIVASAGALVAACLSQAPGVGSASSSQLVGCFGILMIVAFSILVSNTKKWKRDGFIPAEPEVYTAPFAPFDSGLEPEVDQNLVIKAKKTKSKSSSKAKSK